VDLDVSLATPGTVRMAIDSHLNAIIVTAPPAAQMQIGRLISSLDRRRPQVLVEVMLVSVDISEGLSLGVEISGRSIRPGKGETILDLFGSFGLSTVGAGVGGTNVPTFGSGFNGVILKPGDYQVIVRALAQDNRARILASPKLLVNDNTSGVIESLQEEPYTSINSLTPSVATTSFAGFAEAGTTLKVTPHISQGDYLQLEYEIISNTFTAAAPSAGVPPPRSTDRLSSSVTLPDGFTLVVGGLESRSSRKTVDKIPLLGDIPLLKHLFSNETDSTGRERLYIFVRPIILRDDKFEDLKYLSERDLENAEIPSNLPVSGMRLMR
jgi:general secretion pathway protein D